MCTVELKDKRERRRIRRDMRVEETVLRKVSTNEREASSDASKEGTLADGRSASKMHTTQRARQHCLIVAEIVHIGRISLFTEHHVAGAA